jgi:hypothetical protein
MICKIIGHKWIKDVTISFFAEDYIYCKAITAQRCKRCKTTVFETEVFAVNVSGKRGISEFSFFDE